MWRRRRKAADDGRPRVARVNLRLSEDELATLKEAATNDGVSVPRYILDRALSDGSGQEGVSFSERRELSTQLLRLERQVAGIGVNINQMARATNATLEEQPFMAEAVSAARKVIDLIEKTVVGLNR